MTERPPLIPDIFRMIVKMIIGGFVLIGLVSCGVVAIAGASGSGKRAMKEPISQLLAGNEDSENAILRVDIIGPILTHAPEDDHSLFSSIQMVTYGYKVKDQLLAAADDDGVKAVMLFVTTPGGSIVGSQAVHDGVMAVKAAGKPVIAYVDTISASGGVWSTAGADQIYADHGSIIGSVGVNFGNWLYYNDPVTLDNGLFPGGVATRGGVESTFLGAGIGKDLGNPFRPVTEREQALLNATAANFYEKFLDHVTMHRPMDRRALVEEYGAMIFGNDGAKERGYIDDTKNYHETLDYIGEEIGAENDDWKLISPPKIKKSAIEEIFGASIAAISSNQREISRRQAICAELKGQPVIIAPQALSALCEG